MKDTQRFSFSYTDADPDEVSDFYKRKLVPIRFGPLQSGARISNRHEQVSLADWHLWSCMCESGMTLSYKDTAHPETFVLYLPRSGGMDIDLGGRTYSSSEDRAFIGTLTRFEGVVMHPNRAHLAFSMSKAALARQLSAMLDDAVMKDVTFDEEISLKTPKGRQLAELVRFAWHHLQSETGATSTIFYRHLLEATTAMMLETVPNNFSARLSKSVSPAVPRHVKKAIDFMHSHASEALTLAEIAQASETSVRALQSAFQRFKDTTPLQYLRNIRLQAVRDTLESPCNDLSVKEAAILCGFTHMGRFSTTYYEAFGELPSATLKRKR